MLKLIDNFLNKITMYRLVLYVLIFLLIIAGAFGTFGWLPYSAVNLAYSVAIIFFLCWCTNAIFAYAFNAPTNFESTWLTALILALIITPASNFFDMTFLPLAFWASTWAIASKYILAIKKKHIFNPAAFGVAVTGFLLGLSASWWIGTLITAPFVLAGGLLIVRKIHRFDLWWAFMIVFLSGQIFSALLAHKDLLHVLNQSLFYAPIFFFSTIMLTEPLTTPPTQTLRVIYGALVGFLFLPSVHIGSLYFTPELALLIGNLFAYLVSPKSKLMLKLKQVTQLSPDVFEFAFANRGNFSFRPGQYMEWMVPHEKSDSRGLRRYFTIASSPTESDLKLGVKFYNPSSTYKRTLLNLKPGSQIVAHQLAGDFTLPKDKNRKLVFIAGGIGSTPFRSMIQYLLDKREQRDIVILYQNKTPADAVYRNIFERAERELGMKYLNIFGRLDAETIRQNVPDFQNRTYYISGPQGLVTAYKDLLKDMGIKRSRIKTDYFPGF